MLYKKKCKRIGPQVVWLYDLIIFIEFHIISCLHRRRNMLSNEFFQPKTRQITFVAAAQILKYTQIERKRIKKTGITRGNTKKK